MCSRYMTFSSLDGQLRLEDKSNAVSENNAFPFQSQFGPFFFFCWDCFFGGGGADVCVTMSWDELDSSATAASVTLWQLIIYWRDKTANL